MTEKKQESVQKTVSQRRREALQRDAERPKTETVDAEALKADLDELLAEVDGVLEENAEEFVKGYVQKGGE